MNGCIVMAVSKMAAATAAAAMPPVAAATATASVDVPVVVCTAASRRLAAASATVAGLSVAAAALPVTYGCCNWQRLSPVLMPLTGLAPASPYFGLRAMGRLSFPK